LRPTVESRETVESRAGGGAASTLIARRDQTFAGEHIPTVEEVLAFGRERDIGLFLELKPIGPSGAEHALVGALRVANEMRRVVVICFNASSLVKIRALEPMLVTGFLCDENVADAPARAVDAGARQLLPRADLITAALVEEAHRKDLKVVAWTVNETGRMRELIGLGVDGIITDYPDQMVAILRGWKFVLADSLYCLAIILSAAKDLSISPVRKTTLKFPHFLKLRPTPSIL
jgi:glycerophosphoryl diester phosphodiesterase